MKEVLITLEYPPQVGGIATYYENLVKSNDSITVLPLLASSKKFVWLSFFKPVLRAVRGKRIEQLLIGHVLPLGYFGLFFKLFYRKPYRVYAHGVDVLQRLSLWKRFMIRLVLRYADAVIANSRFVADKTATRYGILREKITVEYPRIDVERIEKEAQGVSDIARGDKKIILSVGRLVARKGFDKVIEALGVLDVCYWIIGEGPDRPRLEALVKKYNVPDRVRFLGVVPSPQVYAYYLACDIFIMPSREIDGDVEGFGIVFLEAAVFKKPVIGGRSGGVPEAVVDGVTGLLVEPENVEEIAKALARLLADEMLRKKLGEGGYERVNREFTVG